MNKQKNNTVPKEFEHLELKGNVFAEAHCLYKFGFVMQ